MAHLQQQILDAIADVIAGGGTSAGTRVFVDRVDPLQATDLPAVLVEEAPDGEQVQPYTVHGAYQRQLAVQISCWVAGANAPAQARDLGLAVEKLLQNSATLAALCKLGIELTASRNAASGDGDRLMAVREQAWTFTTLSHRKAPDVAL